MRPRRLLPLALALALVPAAPAAAADWTVDVSDFSFTPAQRQVAVGDSVTWRFDDGGHTSTSRPGQAERWDSGTRASGGTFRHTFTRPGRYQYVCTPHASFMSGLIQVGRDRVADTVDGLRTRRRGRAVTVRFRLNEPAKVTYRLTGPTRRTVRRGRLAAGRRSLTVRGLEPGTYRGTLTAVDDFDKTARPKSSFVIR